MLVRQHHPLVGPEPGDIYLADAPVGAEAGAGGHAGRGQQSNGQSDCQSPASSGHVGDSIKSALPKSHSPGTVPLMSTTTDSISKLREAIGQARGPSPWRTVTQE